LLGWRYALLKIALGRQITDMENYATVFTGLMASLTVPIEFVVIDSPNQISPVMENAIFPSDAFIVPFESTKAVRSYANFFDLPHPFLARLGSV